MKIIKSKLVLILVFFPFLIYAQSMDCSDFFKYRSVAAPWTYNSLSKGALCLTGNKYEFNVPLAKGSDFRLSFYASAVFNNAISFKIIDQNSNKTVMDLPGASEDEKPYSSVLKEFFDEKANKTVHPFFDFYPENATILKIIIDVKSMPQPETSQTGYKAPEQRERGCVTVLILSKPSDATGFK